MQKTSLIHLSSFLFVLLCILLFSACDKEPCLPTRYEFEPMNYEGQLLRLDMTERISDLIDSSLNSSMPNVLSVIQSLSNMYVNTQNAYNEARLDTCGKQLSNKTISSEQSAISQYIDALSNILTNTTTPASKGQSGVVFANNGTPYYIDSNGVELKQIIEKGIMGACFYYQATAVYLGDGKMNVDNQEVVVGKGTDMEHHWDESFGYLGAPVDFNNASQDVRFWAKYVQTVSQTYTPLRDELFSNYIKGRVAIGQDNLTDRDQAIYEIRKNWEILVAGTAIHYLNAAIASYNSGDTGKYHHQLSEAYMFIHSLKFGARTSSLTTLAIDDLLISTFGSTSPLSIDLYQCSLTQLENLKSAIVQSIAELAPHKDQL